MIKIIGVRFRSAGKVYYFDPGDLEPVMGDHVIVETARGPEYGTVSGRVRNVADDMVTQPLREVIRIATEEDTQKVEENRAKEKEALNICREKVRKHNLDMKLVDAEYSFDGSKILFYFTADGRIDFRDLVKDLASVFRMRIELRQIGVRDETKMLGGMGICGRELCCATYLSDFAPVSIKMAKEQNLSLNPAKISGTCGRLMCCLKNEEDTYEYLNAKMPKMGEEAGTADGRTGKVVELNVLRQKAKVMFEDGDDKEIEEFPVDELIFRPRRRKGEKADKPQDNPKRGQKAERADAEQAERSRGPKAERQDTEQAERSRGPKKRPETENRQVKAQDIDVRTAAGGENSAVFTDDESMAGLLAGAALSAAETVLAESGDTREQLKIKAKETTVTLTELELEKESAPAGAIKAEIRKTEETVSRLEIHAEGNKVSAEENREERKDISVAVTLPDSQDMEDALSGQAAVENRQTGAWTEEVPASGKFIFREEDTETTRRDFDFPEEKTENTQQDLTEAEEFSFNPDAAEYVPDAAAVAPEMTAFAPDAAGADSEKDYIREWDGERRKKPRRRRHKYPEDGASAEEFQADAEERASGSGAGRKSRRNNNSDRSQREERTDRETRRKYAEGEQEVSSENRQRRKYAEGGASASRKPLQRTASAGNTRKASGSRRPVQIIANAGKMRTGTGRRKMILPDASAGAIRKMTETAGIPEAAGKSATTIRKAREADLRTKTAEAMPAAMGKAAPGRTGTGNIPGKRDRGSADRAAAVPQAARKAEVRRTGTASQQRTAGRKTAARGPEKEEKIPRTAVRRRPEPGNAHMR